MSCGGRIYKGGMTTVSIPFNVEGYSNLSISYFTSGDYKITKTEEDLDIADGFITYTFTKEELDVLPDGVLNYLVNYEVEGGNYADGGNTNVYLKTPKDYSATSVTEMVQSAYTEGFINGKAQCSGGTCVLQAKSQSIDGEGQGLWNIYPDEGYDGMERVTIIDEGYGQAKYQEGYEAGQEQCSGSSLQIKNALISYDNMEPGYDGLWIVNPDAGYDGMDIVRIHDNGYGNKKYNDGYDYGLEKGVAEQKAKMVSLTANTNGGYSREDGYSDVFVNVSGYNFSMRGTIVFEQDYTIDSDFDIWVFVHRPDGGTILAIDDGYININGEWLGNIKTRGETFSAGSYTFGVAAEESGDLDGIDDFYLEDPIAHSRLGSQPPIHFDNVHIEFSKYPR